MRIGYDVFIFLKCDELIFHDLINDKTESIRVVLESVYF